MIVVRGETAVRGPARSSGTVHLPRIRTVSCSIEKDESPLMPQSMRALVAGKVGEPADVLRLESRPIPTPEAGQALIHVKATPIHASDLHVLRGRYGFFPEFPTVGGHMECVGRIEALGPDTEGLKIGRARGGCCCPGGTRAACGRHLAGIPCCRYTKAPAGPRSSERLQRLSTRRQPTWPGDLRAGVDRGISEHRPRATQDPGGADDSVRPSHRLRRHGFRCEQPAGRPRRVGKQVVFIDE